MAESSSLMPVLSLSHGSGGGWILDGKKHPMVKHCDKYSKSVRFLQGMTKEYSLPTPKAVLVISAHWVEDEFTVCTDPNPGLFYDYMWKLPEEAYCLDWSPPGSPEMALRVKQILEDNGLVCNVQKKRGLDHGVFGPLSHVYPDASIPVFQMSMKKLLEQNDHIRLGQTLRQLRKEGVIIAGSGNTTLQIKIDFSNQTPQEDRYEVPNWLVEWKELLNDAVTNKSYSDCQRKEKLVELMSGDLYQMSLFRGDQSHFIPLLVCLAAADFEPGDLMVEEIIAGELLASQFIFY